MDSNPQQPQAAIRYRAPATLLLFAVSLVLSLLQMGGSPLDRYLLRADGISLEAVLASPLIHATGWHMTLTLALLLLLGGILETQWGTLRFVALYLLAVWGAAGITALCFVASDVTGISCGNPSCAAQWS